MLGGVWKGFSTGKKRNSLKMARERSSVTSGGGSPGVTFESLLGHFNSFCVFVWSTSTSQGARLPKSLTLNLLKYEGLTMNLLKYGGFLPPCPILKIKGFGAAVRLNKTIPSDTK